jgi:hypothetical protein
MDNVPTPHGRPFLKNNLQGWLEAPLKFKEECGGIKKNCYCFVMSVIQAEL